MPLHMCRHIFFNFDLYFRVSFFIHFHKAVQSDTRNKLTISTSERLQIDVDLSHQQDRAVDLVALYGESPGGSLRHHIMVSTTSSWTTNRW